MFIVADLVSLIKASHIKVSNLTKLSVSHTAVCSETRGTARGAGKPSGVKGRNVKVNGNVMGYRGRKWSEGSGVKEKEVR